MYLLNFPVHSHNSNVFFVCLFVWTCQDLLYRRARALADYENSNKALDKARLKSKDIPQAEEHQQQCLQKFDKLSESGKKGLCISARKDVRLLACVPSGMLKFGYSFLTGQLPPTELTNFKGRRVVAFRKNLIEMAELEIKHAKVSGKKEVESWYLFEYVTFSNLCKHSRVSQMWGYFG